MIKFLYTEKNLLYLWKKVKNNYQTKSKEEKKCQHSEY